uniref:Uncharacterized protein n=1 Tax=uncultured bacterium CSLG7 TaxID=1091577 RepID=G4WV34_9BACT|nr:hypothetical protein [uncultured bacterium CSLG7]
MSSTLRRIVFLLTFVVSSVPGANSGGKPGIAPLAHDAKAVLWRDPADIASRDLIYGSGGTVHQPREPFTFIKEDMDGSNPKFDVSDQDGVKWKVKLGAEARPEVAASRLLWAAGYFTTEDYFLEDLHVQGLPSHLHRGQDLVGPDGTLHNVRLKRSMKDQEKVGTWQWGSNPFVGTREFNGLRVMMALLNNWDLKDINNAKYETKRPAGSEEPEQIYLVSDLGASFGTTGVRVPVDTAKGNLEAYKHSKFITNRTPDYVDFGTPSSPALIETFNLPMFIHRVDLRWIGRHVPRADAKWMGQVLSQLSEEQIRDAFRAAGYSSPDVNEFAKVVEGRIAELNAL